MDLTSMLTRFSAAVESGSGDALADLFTEDGVYDDYFFGPSEPGRQGIRDMLAHFYEGGERFKWEFFAPIASGPLGYASYRFSYTSRNPATKGTRVLFEGISRFDLEDGKIKRYSEVFDRSSALAQQDFAPERMKKIAQKYATRLKATPEAAPHLDQPTGAEAGAIEPVTPWSPEGRKRAA